MNKKMLAEVLAKRNNIPYETAYASVDTTLAIISQSIQGGIAVKLRGFGTFTMRERKPRLQRDPKGDHRHTHLTVRAHFTPSQYLRRRVGTEG